MVVEALSGGSLSQLPVLGAGLVLVALGLVVLVRAPRLAFTGWLVVLCFVPVWVGFTYKVGFEGHVVASVGLLLSLLPGLVRGKFLVPPRLTWGDALFALFLLVTLVAVLSGRVTLAAGFVACVQWTVAFLAGRLIGYRVRLSWIYGVFAVTFAIVALLAVIEFVTGWNPFHQIPGDAYLRGVWGAVEQRGGRVRSEGAFGHPIALGASLAFAVPITLAAPFRTVVRLGMAGLMLAAAVLTFSRTGLITAVLGAVLAVLFLRSELPRRLRVAATAGLVVLGVGFASLVSTVFAAAGDEASYSADYRVQLLSLLPDLQPFGWASTAYQLAGRTVLANVESFDGTLHSIDDAFLVVGLSYGWVPMVVVLLGLLVAVCCLFSGRVTAPTIAVVAQIPALATVALITQYSTLTWFLAGLAVFSQSVATRPGDLRSVPPEIRERSDDKFSDMSSERVASDSRAPTAQLSS